ncbi:MAG: SDR family oxidoreductase [Roseibium sp.]
MTDKQNESSNLSSHDDELVDRRRFLTASGGAAGALSMAALAGSAGESAAQSSEDRRVILIADAQTHMMPALALEMARRGHNLVIGPPADGLEAQLKELGAEVEIVAAAENINEAGAAQALVDAAKKRFGKFDSAAIRTGSHTVDTVLTASTENADQMYRDCFLSVMYALQAVLPSLTDQGSGQVLINTSASGYRPAPTASTYSAMRAAANSLIRSAALNVGGTGVIVNGIGTYALDYPGFTESIKEAAKTDPDALEKVNATLPMGRLGQPEECAHLAASFVDGKSNFSTGQFIALDGGWSFV